MTKIYRAVVRGHFADVADDVEAAALERAIGWLTKHGYGHKHLTVSVTDMASMWHTD